MVHDEIVKANGFLFLLLKLEVELTLVVMELKVPLLLKLFPCEETSPEDSHLGVEHVRVPALLEVLLDLPHLPLEGLLLEVGDVAWDESAEDGANLVEIFLMGVEVELEWAESNAAVVECGYLQAILPEDLRHFVSHLTRNSNNIIIKS